MGNVKAITEEALTAFYGSQRFYRHSLVRNVIFTEGCAFLSLNGAGWLIDEIAIVQNTKPFIGEGFQCWKLLVDRDSSTAVLLGNDGGGDVDEDGRTIYKELYRKEIPYTDFRWCLRSVEPW